MTKYIRIFTGEYGNLKVTTHDSLLNAKHAVKFGGGGSIVKAVDVEGPLE